MAFTVRLCLPIIEIYSQRIFKFAKNLTTICRRKIKRPSKVASGAAARLAWSILGLRLKAIASVSLIFSLLFHLSYRVLPALL
ncbi:MAG: hypothetical protein A2V52_00770 [Actinobacteria bacterium RBG_19FT_COMBO_54_7]|uniref:Uncharacterized protein n=1 Tax=Candidatus Solincola sediminis TaxID=1797199 RepID=A0A1F2WKW4_9ACTN|nr:MAG: hypothetical protein A2Y75_00990 [Candidatus Solincola sediminis]OFW59450.1 MAG: hypothetical protein A2W01_11440 [Candidatus Solincola sediminis]OFW65943.1 MAG: hypothetical protein A2V52_00770 [Actinobacteria bacterium RBG_19FT_COMBO_54_7]